MWLGDLLGGAEVKEEEEEVADNNSRSTWQEANYQRVNENVADHVLTSGTEAVAEEQQEMEWNGPALINNFCYLFLWRIKYEFATGWVSVCRRFIILIKLD